MSYPEYNGGASEIDVKQGSFIRRVTADGIAYTLTLNGTQAGFDFYDIERGDELFTVQPLWGVPTGFYVDELSERFLLKGTSTGEGAYEMDVVCRSAANMGDGIISGSIPDVYELTWQQMDQALAAHSTRYTTFKEFVSTTNKTVWGFIQDWINAPSAAEQEGVYKVMVASGTADQQIDFEDYCVMTLRGVESREVFLPVLTRTQVTNTVPTATATPGQIATPPAGFGAIEPTGFTWRRMPDRVSRSGRSGAYNVTSQWIGDPAWDTRLYGTLAEQADDYQSLG